MQPREEEQIHRLQGNLKQRPLKRKMRRYDLLEASGSYLLGFALGCGVASVVVQILVALDSGASAHLGADIFMLLMRLVSGVLAGFVLGFIPACFFFAVATLARGRSRKEPRTGRLPILCGAGSALIGILGGYFMISVHSSTGLEGLVIGAALTTIGSFYWMRFASPKTDGEA